MADAPAQFLSGGRAQSFRVIEVNLRSLDRHRTVEMNWEGLDFFFPEQPREQNHQHLCPAHGEGRHQDLAIALNRVSATRLFAAGLCCETAWV